MNILITGENSYIGNFLEKWLNGEPDKYNVVKLGVQGDSWKAIDFQSFDVMIHVAAAVHTKESKKNKSFFYAINRDLTEDLARKAKTQGVSHFIFLSTMAVYGMYEGFITKETIPKPNTAYGKSKLEGEKLLAELADDSFQISIIRPPLVYGKGCKGNYESLSRAAKVLPIFPKTDNLRSMIYVDNLTEFIKQLIDGVGKNVQSSPESGIVNGGVYFPQNREYVNVSELLACIAKVHGRKIRMTPAFNSIIGKMKWPVTEKLFGDLQYHMDMSEYIFDYRVCDFKESIKQTERNNNA